MNNFAKSQLITQLHKAITWLLLSGVLLINSCSCNKPTKKLSQKENKPESVDNSNSNEQEKDKSKKADNSTSNKEEKDKSESVDNSNSNEQEKDKLKNPTPATPNEIIVFCGNPGVGKSSLCNSIFQQAVFRSGAKLGSGLTTHKQDYLHDNKLYIDTPGLDDIQQKEQAAREIEKALKHNNKYKIIFVVTLDSGRIRPADLVTINKVCNAIKTHFNYGLIFNKLTDRIINKINQESLEQYLTKLNKKPSSIIFLRQHKEMDDEEDKYFQANDENRQKVLNFISGLSANKILDSDIGDIDIRDFQGEINRLEQLLRELQRQ